jgi:hypothetical protein
MLLRHLGIFSLFFVLLVALVLLVMIFVVSAWFAGMLLGETGIKVPCFRINVLRVAVSISYNTRRWMVLPLGYRVL